MEFILLPLVVILIAITLMCIYSISNTNRKLQRLRRRYDFLLRGRGELNLEELIVQYGEELDGQINRQDLVDKTIAGMEERLLRIEGDQESLVDQRTVALEERIRRDFQGMNDQLSSAIKRLDETVYARIDAVEKNADLRLTDGLKRLDGRLNKLTEESNSRIKKHEEENYVQFDSVQTTIAGNDKRIHQLMQDNFKKTHESMAANERKADQQLAEAEARVKNEMTTQLSAIRDQLATSLQKVNLYRYNAFEDLTGEQSFSLVLLDEHHNGFIITSIYSRRGSSIFSKNIKEGAPVQSLSPEEKQALNGALKRN